MRISRRRFLGLAAAASGGAAAGSLASRRPAPGDERAPGSDTPPASPTAVSFYGTHQAGVLTPQQDHLLFASFDVTADRLEDVRVLLSEWTRAAADLTVARKPHAVSRATRAALADSGEALDLGPARLTLTFGLGPDLFGTRTEDRFGLAARRPPALVGLPPFAGDQLETERTGGDLCIQACADNPQVAFHAVRNLAMIGRGAVVLRWLQRGFRSSPQRSPLTGRNLLGFRDGTNNLDPDDGARMASNVWVGPGDRPPGMVGGTYMVVRRIRMRLEHWDAVSLAEQERTFGRRKISGAPFGRDLESDPVVVTQLPPDCHIIQANPRTAGNEAERILRRSYSFADGLDSRFGELDAGLFFVCFQRDPRRQFIPIQQRLSQHDHLREYIFHTGGGIFAIPPGIHPGGSIAGKLFTMV